MDEKMHLILLFVLANIALLESVWTLVGLYGIQGYGEMIFFFSDDTFFRTFLQLETKVKFELLGYKCSSVK
jgi:hypothetical protein